MGCLGPTPLAICRRKESGEQPILCQVFNCGHSESSMSEFGA